MNGLALTLLLQNAFYTVYLFEGAVVVLVLDAGTLPHFLSKLCEELIVIFVQGHHGERTKGQLSIL